MSGIRVVVADDEPHVRRAILRQLAAETDVRVVGEARDGNELLRVVREQRPDLLFLDVQMPERDGFAALEALPPEQRPVVVFVTAYSEHALRAFDAHAADYLLKPFDPERFVRALERGRQRLRQLDSDRRGEMGELLRSLAGARAAAGRIPIRKGGRLLYVDVDRIDAVEAAGNYVTLHAGPQKHLLRDTLGRMEERLAGHGFIRIHRSALVRGASVRELRPLPSGDASVILHSGLCLRVSRTHRESFERRMDR